MNTQQTIKAIVDSAVNDDYAAAEKALLEYASNKQINFEEEPSEDKRKKEIMKAYSDGVLFGFGQAYRIIENEIPRIADSEKYFNENFNE